jgi:Trypsin
LRCALITIHLEDLLRRNAAHSAISCAPPIYTVCPGRHKDRMKRAPVILIASLVLASSARAMVGGALEIPAANTQPEVMFVGSGGSFCTGVTIARDLVLTAAHCIHPGDSYKLVELDADHKPIFKDTLATARHPQFNLKTMLAHRATADVALIKLKAPLSVRPAPLLPFRPRIAIGERFVVHGYGASVRGDGNSAGRLREATLAATGQPGNLQLRLVDPAGGGARAGLGACTGDSGAPVYQQTAAGLAIIGVVSWSTGPNGEDGCGGFTGVTPLELYRGWIEEQAKRMGSAIAP